MSRRILIVTAVQAEANAIGQPHGTFVVSSGIGKTNAALKTTASILTDGPFSWVISAGLAGALPESNLKIGDIVVADQCVYADEGMMTPDGFETTEQMGFPLGEFEGNTVPVDPWMLEKLRSVGEAGSIATVSTCSGTNEYASIVKQRTQSVCEAMEGAAVVHAAMRLGAKAIEIRAISNTTGDRHLQEWNIELALKNLGIALNDAIQVLWGKS